MAEPHIKPDPEGLGASPGGFEDEDIYEDAGDLEFNINPDFQKLYLAKVPRYIWDAWSKLDDNAEIRIGTIRQTNEVQANGEIRHKMHMLLGSDIAAHQGIPKEYELDITEEKVKNTFIFTEKDLPGFKSKSKEKFDLATANMPSRLTRPKNDKPMSKEPYDPNKRFQPYFRKAIPKRTAIAGRVQHEINCIAVVNEESDRILAQRTTEAMRPKMHTTFMKDDLAALGPGFIVPGSIGAQNAFNSFVKTKNSSSGARPQMAKAARIPENELMDRLVECFRRYNYWSMKALRAELQQPEAYLRETLDKIAVLAKSGRFATQWSLKQGFRDHHFIDTSDAVAPAAEGDAPDESDMADEEDGDEDEDVKFEDVA